VSANDCAVPEGAGSWVCGFEGWFDPGPEHFPGARLHRHPKGSWLGPRWLWDCADYGQGADNRLYSCQRGFRCKGRAAVTLRGRGGAWRRGAAWRGRPEGLFPCSLAGRWPLALGSPPLCPLALWPLTAAASISSPHFTRRRGPLGVSWGPRHPPRTPGTTTPALGGESVRGYILHRFVEVLELQAASPVKPASHQSQTQQPWALHCLGAARLLSRYGSRMTVGEP
jgi:hypothetical protein